MTDKFSLNKIKTINAKSRDLSFGFLHEIETQFDTNDNPFYILPDLVGYIVLVYYHIAEFFTVYGPAIQYDEETNTITNIGGEDQCAYGNIAIDANNLNINEYIWTLKIVRNKSKYIYIGIDASNKQHTKTDFGILHSNDSMYVAYGQATLYHNAKLMDMEYEYTNCSAFHDGQVIKIRVNIEKKELIFNHVGRDVVCTGTEEFFKDRIYNLVVNLVQETDCVQLIDFECS